MPLAIEGIVLGNVGIVLVVLIQVIGDRTATCLLQKLPIKQLFHHLHNESVIEKLN